MSTAQTQMCYTMTGTGPASDPKLLKESTRPKPMPSAAQVLVKVKAAALNPIDYKICAGLMPVMTTPPLVPGRDFSGVVEEAGAESGFASGDEVFGDVGNLKLDNPVGGSLSEYILVDAKVIGRKPVGMSFTDAASLSLVGQTALDSVNKAAPAEGARVLVLGASGGVGTLAVQMYKARGLVVIGVCSGKNVALVTSLGAAEVIDYKKVDWSEKLSADAEKVDIVFDFAPSGTDSTTAWYKATKVLKQGGKFITISGEHPEGRVTIGGLLCSMCTQGVRNIASGFSYSLVLKSSSSTKLAEITSLVEAGKLRAVVEQVYPWAQVNSAFEKLMSGRAVGKLVVTTE